MNILFIIKEGIINLGRARLATVISIISIALSLTLIGIFLILGYNLKNIFNQSYQQIEIEAFLDPSLSANELDDIRKKISNKSEVREVKLISPDQALEIYQQSFGEDLSGVLSENPLPPSLRILLEPSFSNPDSIEALTKELVNISGLQEVWYHEEIVRLLNNYFKLALVLAIILAIILFISTTIFVFNTIRLTIHSRKNIIQIMRLVGATNVFIKSPFVIEGIIQGIFGGIISAAIVKMLLNLIEFIFATQIAVPNYLWGMILSIGIILGLIGSYISVNKYL
jgi:cell division transport system permease protein